MFGALNYAHPDFIGGSRGHKAAAAIASEMMVVTHNTKHFAHIPNPKRADWFSEKAD